MYYRIRSFFLPLALVIIAIICAQVIIDFKIKASSARQEEFLVKAEKVSQLISIEFDRLESVVEGLSSLYLSSERVDRKEFHIFCENLLKKYPNILALEWVPRIPFSEKEKYIEEARKSYPLFNILMLNQKGKLVPVGSRPEYFPVYYVEPYKGNERALGFDLSSNPERMRAIKKAIVEKRTISTNPIKLIQRATESEGFLLIRPIFKPKFNGLVVGVFSFVLATGNLQDSDLKYAVLDQSDSILYTSDSNMTKSEFDHIDATHKFITKLPVAQMKWKLCIFDPDFAGAKASYSTYLEVYSIIVLITVCLYLLIRYQLYIRKQELLQTEAHENAMIIHDLRNNVNILLQTTNLLEMNPEDTSLQKTLNPTLKRSLSLLESLLDLKLYKSNQLTPNLVTNEILPLVDYCLKDVEPMSANKSISIKPNLSLEGITLRCDEQQIKRVLINVFLNAIKFTPSGQTISFSSQLESNKMILVIKNPVDDTFLKETSTEFEGRGLGLIIAKRLVHAHKGKITFKTKENQFFVTIELPTTL
ncbi:MAG: CHASE domain-containing protein [Simkaniaceae bacterium]|nr:CHASE domain-containing protein [Simkaniaceae bacterium]